MSHQSCMKAVLLVRIVSIDTHTETHTDTKNVFIEDRFLGLVQKCSKCSDVK